MGKTADLTVAQKKIIDSLHKEGKPQKVIAKKAGCSQSSVSKHITGKLTGREKCGRKRCTSSKDDCSLEMIVKKSQFKNLKELYKEWTEAGVKASRATMHRRLQVRGHNCRISNIKPLLNQRLRQQCIFWAKEKKNWDASQWCKFFPSDESTFFISFGNQAPRVWRKSGDAQSPRSLTSSLKFPQYLMIWGVYCWSWSTVFYQVQRQSHLPGDFRATLTSMGYCREEDEKHPTQKHRWAEGHYRSNLGFSNASAVPQADRLHHMLNWCSNWW